MNMRLHNVPTQSGPERLLNAALHEVFTAVRSLGSYNSPPARPVGTSLKSRSNIAAEARAKIVYERLINITDDPGIKEALGFLMTREVTHQKSLKKALYAIKNNFPSGKLPGVKNYASMYVNTSQGEGDTTGPWHSGSEWDRIDDLEDVMPVDGGDGTASVKLDARDKAVVARMMERTILTLLPTRQRVPAWVQVLALAAPKKVTWAGLWMCKRPPPGMGLQ